MTTLTGACPQCGATALHPDEQGGILCHQCGASFRPSRLTCAACGAVVDAGADACPACGALLGIAGQVLGQRGQGSSPQFLQRTREQAPALRASGEQSSRERFEAFEDIDRRRERNEATRRAARTVDDRRALGLLGVALGVLVVVLGIALVVTVLR